MVFALGTNNDQNGDFTPGSTSGNKARDVYQPILTKTIRAHFSRFFKSESKTQERLSISPKDPVLFFWRKIFHPPIQLPQEVGDLQIANGGKPVFVREGIRFPDERPIASHENRMGDSIHQISHFQREPPATGGTLLLPHGEIRINSAPSLEK